MDKVLRFWWGGKLSDMSKNRHKCYRSIIRNSGIKNIEMITLENYKKYEIKTHPIHQAFEYLSGPHQSDYMRFYITYYYGGGWTDIKYCDYDWNAYFDLLEKNSNKEGIGCKILEVINGVYRHWTETENEFWNCLGMQHFIFKKDSIIFKECLVNAEKILTDKLNQLKCYPGNVHPLICKDYIINSHIIPEHLKSYNYPLNWLEISQLFYFAQKNNLDKIMYGMPKPHNINTGFNHR